MVGATDLITCFITCIWQIY